MLDPDLHKVTLTVNGTTYTETVESRWSLADFLRHKLGQRGRILAASMVYAVHVRS